MRRSLPLLVLLLAGTASCGGGNRTPEDRRPQGIASEGNMAVEAPPAPRIRFAVAMVTAAPVIFRKSRRVGISVARVFNLCLIAQSRGSARVENPCYSKAISSDSSAR